jgi:hypothetical protein
MKKSITTAAGRTVNVARGVTKSFGERLRSCSPRKMNPERATELSPKLQRALGPLLAEIESLLSSTGLLMEGLTVAYPASGGASTPRPASNLGSSILLGLSEENGALSRSRALPT